MMMVDGFNWIVYAFLIDNVFPIGVTNAFGWLAGSTYSAVYLINCRHDKREHVRREAWSIVSGALLIVTAMAVSATVIAIHWSRETSSDSIGYVVDMFNVCLYASPLALAWKVFRTHSTSGMYLPLSLAITAAAALWATYGFLMMDWFVAAPQSVGLLAGLAQLSLFLRFGVADNNEPSGAAAGRAVALETGVDDDSSKDPAGYSSDDSAAPAPGRAGDGGDSQPPGKLSDGSDPSKRKKPRRGGGGKGQLGEPLITGT
ncbi:unnamed protein product [Scytosiphon promiscuus]